MKTGRIFLVTAMAAGLAQAAASKPNFVFFLSDDQLKADYGCYGLPLDLTPTTDQLAKQGLVFEKMFTAEPICAPSRAMLFTGQYPVRNGLFVQHTASRAGTKTVYDALTPLGYDVSLIGKVHVKPNSVFRWSSPATKQNIKALPMEDVDAYFAKNKEKPFCLFLTSHYPHGPYPAKPKFPQDQVVVHPFMKGGSKNGLAGYYDHISKKEKELAQVLQLLEKYKLDENTVFVYSSDHGNGMGAKYTVYDRGLNVPFIVRWLGRIKPGRTKALSSYADVVPTFVELAGGEPVDGVDGKSFASILKNPEEKHQKYVYGVMTQQGVWGTHVFPRRSVHNGRFHYIYNFNTLEKIARDESKNKTIDPFHRIGAEMHPEVTEEELYDTDSDPWELNNLASNPSLVKIKSELKGELFQWMESQNDFLTEGGEIPYLKSKHPVDQSSEKYTCPPELEGAIKTYLDPHNLTE
ncbi:sulfatase family protein [Pontiella sulfatireligans]|uniref:Arylsulfatase n=1 Tax=Pontiella sulfatireligans TaxID=2750658 RepID=A0A6C2USN4_9BACT|nr:sulfatase [Pontiella sulfatireligans]SPS74549.1 sulfatase S1_8 [Kiritimatiellales bacterium]VGO23149.1 Arylsulfatase [Pontiella sulfatireligans]